MKNSLRQKSDHAESDNGTEIKQFIAKKNWTLRQAADALGDSEARLQKVLNGEEPLGKTAALALNALKNGLSPINRENHSTN